MKVDIHPTNYSATVTCACGNTFATISTKEAISTEICSACHPFFTGKQKVVDSARRVEKFEAKAVKQQEKSSTSHRSKRDKQEARKAKKNEKHSTEAKKSAKEALKAAKSALSDL